MENRKKIIFPEMLYVEYTKKCNSRCITCDYWKTKEQEEFVDNKKILTMIEQLYNLGLKVVLFTGGEALLRHNDLFRLCRKIKKNFPKLKLRLLTNGVLVDKHKKNILEIFDSIVFSFDACTKEQYKIIRGIDAFDIVVNAIDILRRNSKTIEIRLRAMALKDNYENMLDIIELASKMGVNKISFLPVDMASQTAFGRDKGINVSNNITDIDILKLEKIINETLDKKESLKKSGLIIDEDNNLGNILNYYKLNKNLYSPQCNAPINSIVLTSDGNILPCFFLDEVGNIKKNDILEILASKQYLEIKREMLSRSKKECQKCIL